MYYHPGYPQTDVEVNAVVSHINNPADFYIQVVTTPSVLYLNTYTHQNVVCVCAYNVVPNTKSCNLSVSYVLPSLG